MPCKVVVGAQFGSEGKGKVITALVSKLTKPMVVRCGGPNAGHSTIYNGKEVVVRQLPSGVAEPSAQLVIGSAALINEDVLIKEIERFSIPKERIFIDSRCILITDKDQVDEKLTLNHVSSTCSGSGAAQIRRIQRLCETVFAAQSKSIAQYATICDTISIIHKALDENRNVIIEGTQGFQLSLYHGNLFPFVTSRDTTAAACISEVGISPLQVDEIILVIRTFPIRVGKCGPLSNEVTWEHVAMVGGASIIEPEFGSVTKRPRRVGLFNLDDVRRACLCNRPSGIALLGVDRLDVKMRGVKKFNDLSQIVKKFIDQLEKDLNVPIILVGTGFRANEIIWRN